MQRLFLCRNLIRCGGPWSNPPLPVSRCYHASLPVQFSDSKKRKRKRRSKSRRTHGNEERQESMQDWVAQDFLSTESATQETSLQNHAHSSSLPLELWSELKSDPTFFHGRKGLALEWTLPSVHTSQHPGVKAILKDIQSGAPDVHVEEVVDWSPEAHAEEEVDWSDENDDREVDDDEGGKESEWH